jgi:proprotein convertase subtilisin/kexin type 5
MLCDDPGNWESKDRGCVCKEGFFKQGDLGSAVCVDCKLTLQGCKKCSSSTLCDVCEEGSPLHWIANGTTRTCKCANGFYVNGVNQSATCLTCESAMPGCQECNSNSVCTACDTANQWIADADACKCADNFWHKQTGTLDTCEAGPLGCLTPVDSITCQPTGCNTSNEWVYKAPTCECKPRYFQDMSDPREICRFCGIGCESCSIANDCICRASENWVIKAPLCGCDAGYRESAIKTDGDKDCIACIAGCTICYDSSTCNTCRLPGWKLNAEICECKQGYFSNALNCKFCGKGCDVCGSDTTCATCNDPGHWTSDGATGCECKPGFGEVIDSDDPSNNTCEPCSNGCLNC